MDKETLKRQLGKNLRHYRKARHFTQARLAELINVEPSFIAHIESGYTGMDLYHLYLAAEALDVSCSALLCGETDTMNLENICKLLSDKPPEYVASIEKIVRVCVEEFERKDGQNPPG